MRYTLSELSAHRVLSAAGRRIRDVPHRISWSRSETARVNRARLARLRDARFGDRCVLVANGPSLATMDLSALANETVISVNRAYLLYGVQMPTPTYYACLNSLVLEQFATDIDALPMLKFVNWEQRDLFAARDDLVFLRTALTLADSFCGDVTKPICSGGTVTFVSLQIAYFLGFREVAIIGMDHDFKDKGRPNQTEVRKTEVDHNHFHPDYFPKGTRWQLPDLTRSEQAYGLARQAFEHAGGRILDATVNGKCTVFEKIDFHAALARPRPSGCGRSR